MVDTEEEGLTVTDWELLEDWESLNRGLGEPLCRESVARGVKVGVLGEVAEVEWEPKGGVGVGLVDWEALGVVQGVEVGDREGEAEEVEEWVMGELALARRRGVGVSWREGEGRVEEEGLARDTVVRMEGEAEWEGEAVEDTVGVKLPPSTPFPRPPPPEKVGVGVA